MLPAAVQGTDQRGAGFPRGTAGTVDIGAYELQPLSTGEFVHDLYVDWGTNGSDQLTLDGQNLVPQGRKNDLPWYAIDKLQITLSQPAVLTAADVMLGSTR